MRLIAAPLAIDIIEPAEEEKGGAIEFSTAPVREVEGEIVVDEYACSVGAFILSVSLVFAVTVVKQLYIH